MKRKQVLNQETTNSAAQLEERIFEAEENGESHATIYGMKQKLAKVRANQLRAERRRLVSLQKQKQNLLQQNNYDDNIASSTETPYHP